MPSRQQHGHTTKQIRMKLQERIQAFEKLGQQIAKQDDSLKKAMEQAEIHNPWFTPFMQTQALQAISTLLSNSSLNSWLQRYDYAETKSPKTVAVIMAGNIPLVGFHDLLSVLVSGHRIKIKESEKDSVLMKYICRMLIDIEPGMMEFIEMTDKQLRDFDAVIATGSDNSAQHFEQYFAKYPHIIRKNRHAVAVLTGHETDEQLSLLADDICLYFGLGCRNVSSLFVPHDYDFSRFYKAINKYEHLKNHNKYVNNYEYNRAIYLINLLPHLDNGFLILKPCDELSSPVAVVYTRNYNTIEEVNTTLALLKDQLQCVVSIDTKVRNSIAPGKAQQPSLSDYADDIDTMQFLLNL